MSQFTDSKGRAWTIKLDAPLIREVKQLFDVNLADTRAAWIERLDADFLLLVDVLWVLCRPQANQLAPSVSDREFGEALVGDPIEYAAKALKEAYIDFFPKQRRALLQEIARREEDLEREALERALARVTDPQLKAKTLEAYEAGLDRRFEESLRQLSSASDSPDSSA